MSKVSKVTSLKASPETVFDYISDVDNHPAFISALKSVTNIDGSSRAVGAGWDWTFEMGGVVIVGRAETAECVEGRRFSFRTTTGIESTFTYDLEPEGAGSHLTITVDYEVPQGVLAKVLDHAVVERMNDKEGDRAVENLKTIFADG